MTVNNQTKVSVMESTVIELPEEQKPFPRFLSLAVSLVFPILFEFRNDPRKKNTPKVKLLFSSLNFNPRRLT